MKTDITKCDFYYSCGGQAHCSVGTYYAEECEENPDCYYKQLQQLKEENEELRQVRKDLPDIQQPYVILYRKLKKENHELRKLIKTKMEELCDSCGASSMMPMPCKIMKGKLQKIKSICNFDIEHQGYATPTIDDILQIIEEE